MKTFSKNSRHFKDIAVKYKLEYYAQNENGFERKYNYELFRCKDIQR